MARSLRLLACAAVAAALTVPAGAGASAEGHAKKADLVVASVKAPASAEAGGAVAVRVKVHNGGKAKAPASVVRLALSTDRAAGGDKALKPTLAVPSLSPGGSWSGKVRATLPATTAVGSYYVVACADAQRRVGESNEGNNCRASATLGVTAPRTSHDLIDADVTSGALTAEQGLVYKVFSDFGDPRLPAKYAAATDGVEEGALTEVAEGWDALSPTTQDTLRPFLIPPFYPGSHWTPATTGKMPAQAPTLDSPWCSGSSDVQPAYQSWEHLDSASGNFRIWWLKKNPGDAALASRMSAVLEGKILPELAKLMGHSYKPDGGGFCDGGSGALDIALVDAATALTYPDDSCGPAGTSVHMVWPRTKPAPWADIEPYLAHEVMHAIQFGMPVASSCGDSSWLREMTAEWVQDYVTDPIYPVGLAPDDTEHLAAPLYLDRPNVSLDAATPAKHDYGSYLFPFWAAHKTGPSIVREMWTNAATMTPVAAVDAAVGGFDAVWPEFALANFNRAPVDDYQGWDQLTLGAKTVGPEPVKVGTRSPTVDVKHLAAQYLALDIDKDVSEIEVTNDLAGQAHASLQAVIEYSDGSTKIVPMSAQETTTICIDDGTKRATSVVLVFANSDQTSDLHFAPTIVGKAVCGCPDSSARTAPRAGATCTGNITFSWTHDTLKLEADGSDRYHWEESGNGSLGLGFLPPDPDEPGIWPMDPASTYSVHLQRHSEYYWGCEEVVDTTQDGSGTLDELATSAAPAPDDSGQLWVNDLIGMKATSKSHSESNLCGPSDDTTETVLTVPDCPVLDSGGSFFWEFEPTAPQSKSYEFSCTDHVQYEDGLGIQTWTVSISGTITLP